MQAPSSHDCKLISSGGWTTMRGSLNKTKNKAAQQRLEKAQLAVSQSNHGNQQGDTNMEGISMPSLDKTKSNSTMRLKLKPIRGSLKKAESQAQHTENGEKSNINMDDMALPDMLRFLEKEEALLTQLQSKMSAELSHLQVEEHVFLHTLKILSQKHASTNKVKEDHQETSSGDRDLIDALNEALMENGESVPSN